MHDCVLWTGRTRTSFARPEPRRRRGPRCAGMLPPIGARPCRATDRKIAVLPPVNRSTQSPREPGRVGMARLRTGHRWYGGGRIPPHVARPLPAHRGVWVEVEGANLRRPRRFPSRCGGSGPFGVCHGAQHGVTIRQGQGRHTAREGSLRWPHGFLEEPGPALPPVAESKPVGLPGLPQSKEAKGS
jgi:hypothetical protein